MSHFYFTLQRINPQQIISLTLSNMDDTPGQFRLFLNFFSLKQFLNLEVLQLLQPPNTNDFNKILSDLPTNKTLKSLTILHCQSSSVNQQTFQILSSFINNSKSLRRLSLSGTLNSLFEYQFNSSVDYLYFNDNIFNTLSLPTIASRMPNLIFLDTAITTKSNSYHLSLFNHLTRLILTTFIEMTKFEMENLLKSMPKLLFFKLTANGKQWFNGQFWEQCLPLTVEIFEFNFCTQLQNLNVEIILETFQTSFWLDIKHWYVMLDYQMNPTMVHLYSLPFCDTQFYYRPSIDPIQQCRSSITVNQICMKNVTKLTLDLSTLNSERKHLINDSSHYFPNVSTLILTDYGCHLSTELVVDFLQSILDFTHITDLKLGQFHHPEFIRILYNHMPSLKYLRITETLLIDLDMIDFSNIHSLTICDCLSNIERIHLLFPHIKYLCVRLITFENIRKLFEYFGQNLRNITFRHINQDLKEVTIEWLSNYCNQHHRRYSYDIDQHMDLHIWLD
ncbi:hypothetical protein I4U23_001337 [Adineta vaga]|nr:hypothetical protein I4U23_001337 [Adineta vaga]